MLSTNRLPAVKVKNIEKEFYLCLLLYCIILLVGSRRLLSPHPAAAAAVYLYCAAELNLYLQKVSVVMVFVNFFNIVFGFISLYTM